jgi:hypothetical protein
MADNTQLPLGTLDGDIYASDDVGGVKVQRVKVQTGVDGSAIDVSTSNPMPVNDAGVSLTVDAPANTPVFVRLSDGSSAITNLNVALAAAIPAGANTIGNVGVTSLPALAAGTNAIGKLSANSGVIIGDVNVVSDVAIPAGSNTIGSLASITTSIVPGTGATNLGKAEDAAHTSGDTGVLAMGVRQDADASPVSATGDYQAFLFDSAGNLKVNIKAGAGSGGTALADNAAFTRGTTSLTPSGAMVETAAPTLTNGNIAALSQTTSGALRVSVASGGIAGVLEDAASAGGEEGILAMAVRQDTPSSTTSADGDWTYLKVNSVGALHVTGAGGGTQYVEDVASAGGETGTLSLAIRQDTPSTTTSADGDFSNLKVDSTGRLWTNVGALPASTNTLEVVGDVAQDAPISGNPVAIALRASTATPTAMSADGDSVYAWSDRSGATIINGSLLDDSAFTPATSRVVAIGYTADETATDSVDEGDIGIPRITLDRKTIVSTYAHAAGGYTPGKLTAASTTNATSVKASAGTLGMCVATNTNAAVRYLKFYNKATAPTVGTDTPILVFAIPGATTGGGVAVPIPPQGLNFNTGIAFALTTGATDADTGAVAANEILVNYGYI